VHAEFELVWCELLLGRRQVVGLVWERMSIVNGSVKSGLAWK